MALDTQQDGTDPDEGAAGADRRFARLAQAIKQLSAARTRAEIVDVVRRAARDVTGALGVAIVLREGDTCHYIAEDSAVPLWSGQRFPMDDCISGWAMRQARQTAVADIYADPRIPHEAYRPTGIHSLIMTPVGEPVPIAALGAYWAEVGEPSADDAAALDALAGCLGAALQSEAADRQVRFQADLLDAVGEAVIASDSAGLVTFWNRAAEELYGWRAEEALGRQIVELTPAPDSVAQSAEIMNALGRGEAWSGEIHLRRRDGSDFPALVTDTALRGADGEVVGMVGVSRDVSDRRRAEEHKQLLIHELNHRVKNTLAIVQSLAAQTLRGERSFASAREDLDSRLMALAGAHSLMTETGWQSVDLCELVRRAVAVFAGAADRVTVKGPDIQLEPKSAVAMALAIHELCTNASKYGALSTPAGGVEVTWTLTRGESGPRLTLTWREHGGPPVEPPRSRGFGSRLLERGLASELHGAVRLEFPPEGAVCTIEAPAPLGAGGEDDELFQVPA